MKNPTAYNRSQIPIIDFSDVENPAKKASVIRQLSYAFENFGFFEAVNTCVSPKCSSDAFNISKAFFEQPKEKKQEVVLDVKENKPAVAVFEIGWKPHLVFGDVICPMEEYVFRHYHQSPDMPPSGRKVPQDISGVTDLAKISENLTFSTLPNVYPTTIPQFKETITRLQNALGTFMDLLLDLVSESLGLPPTFIRKQYHDNSLPRNFNLHYYHKKSENENNDTTLGLSAHRDSSILSILGQGFEADGLEINVTGENYLRALPSNGSLIVNVGDMLQVWTNGRYRSILHRVVYNPSKGRYSFAYFSFPCEGPGGEKVIEPIPQIITPENPTRYKPFTFYEFFQNKFSRDSINLLAENEIKAAA